MKRHFTVTLLFCIIITTGFSQAAKSVYVELGGPGLASANFDMRLTNKEDGPGFRIGIGGLSIGSSYSGGGTRVLTLPFGLTWLLGKDQKNYFELGAGITPVFSKQNYNSKDEFTNTFGHLYFGYRLQPVKGGFLFRAGITPVFGKGYFIPYYAGISFGYKF